MHYGNNLLSIILVFCCTKSLWAQRACMTPQRENGVCILYRQCEYLKQQYSSFNQMVPPEFKEYLRNSRCQGPNNSDIYICCPATREDTAPKRTTSAMSNNPTTSNRNLDPKGVAVLNAVKCGAQNSNRISHGNKTDLAEFPWMALLRYNNDDLPYQCGGSLITNRYVVTAAHCVVDVEDDLIGVVLGEHDLSTPKDCQRRGSKQICSPPVENFNIELVTPHPNYSKHYMLNDIALLRLDRNVVFKIHIKPICLPIVPSAAKPVNNEYFIAGWGTTEMRTTSTVLLRAKLQHRDISVCAKIFKQVRFTENHICAGGDGISDSCKGDSGGPLFYLADYKGIPRYVQFGIVSFGGLLCGSGRTFPGIYANMLDLLPWVTQNIS